MDWFISLDGYLQALLATAFTYLMTALGASLVLFYKRVGKTAFCFMLSGAAGIMLASSFFSLLLPALEQGGEYSYLILTAGFVAGGLIIILCDTLLKLVNKKKDGAARSNAVMCIAVTVHNIPEGLAVGVAFGAIASSGGNGAVAALMLALGIGIQNFPEGMCVAFPLRANGMGRFKSFFIGQLSGAVEIVAGVIGAIAVSFISGILPFALAFSSGAMIAVVCSELVPESFASDKLKATIGVIFGFALMMILDIALG
ncbi:MAG: ZIP family metal transporter [Candidatus Coproplasma sp.]